jgi:diguanylate cyclase (GGDEF)-like protein/PAS domain S-box-containing protein
MVEDGAGFRAMFEHSPVAQVLMYRDQAGMVANQAFADLFGYERGALEQLSLADLVPEADKSDVLAQRELLETGTTVDATTEQRYVRADGTVFFGRGRVSAVPGANGDIAYLLGVIEDITDQVLAAASLTQNEERFRALVDNSPDIIITVYPDRAWTASNAGTQLLGYPKGWNEVDGVLALVHPDDVDKAAATLAEILEHPGVMSAPVELRLRTIDGEYLDFECVGQNLGLNDAIGGVVITARHITERKRTERSLRAAAEQFRAVFEHAPVAVTIVDLEGRIIDVNYAGCAMLGRTRQELPGSLARDIVHPDDRERSAEVGARQLSGKATPTEFRLLRADGTALWVTSNSSLVDPGGDDEPYVVSIQADITDRRMLESRLEHEASRDQLTGVMNRGALMSQLEFALLQRQTTLLGVLFVDLDYFKVVNDTFGHEAGDAVLSTIAKRIQDSVREGDIVGRLGGDEFVVLCHDVTGLSEAIDVGQRLRDAVARPISIRGGTATVDASVGVTLGSTGDDAASLMRRVDRASYRAKETGRGRVVAADDADDNVIDEVKRSA